MNYIQTYVTRGWQNIKNEIDSITDIYTIEETIDLFSNEYYYKNYFGKAKNRTLIKDNPILYKSLYENTSILEDTMIAYGKSRNMYTFTTRMKFLVELNGDIEKLKCDCGRSYTWNTYCKRCPEPKKTWAGRTHTDKTKRKQRLSTIKYLKKTKGQVVPRYNINSIPILEAKAKELGITDLQHAENGGEFHIKELGYWVDGYSEELNIVIEYDEQHHTRYIKEDKQRQREIEDYLGCTFIRICE